MAAPETLNVFRSFLVHISFPSSLVASLLITYVYVCVFAVCSVQCACKCLPLVSYG